MAQAAGQYWRSARNHFLAIEIRQNSNSLEMNRRIVPAEAYSTRTIAVQYPHVEAAMSSDFGDTYVTWQQGGSKALTDAERFRVLGWGFTGFRNYRSWPKVAAGLLNS